MAEFTGKKMLAVTVSFFAVIIGVNGYMAYKAGSTFPGIEVANSYVASQNFNERRDEQLALGWDLATDYEDGKMIDTFTDKSGESVEVDNLRVLIGRTTIDRDDVEPLMARIDGRYIAEVPLEKGQWMIKVWANAKNGTLFEKRVDFYVRG